jgi:hypothetical protein
MNIYDKYLENVENFKIFWNYSNKWKLDLIKLRDIVRMLRVIQNHLSSRLLLKRQRL